MIQLCGTTSASRQRISRNSQLGRKRSTENFRNFRKSTGRSPRQALPVQDRLLSDTPAGKDAVATLQQSITALSKRRSEILTSAGYPSDYLQMTYRCPDCQDTGYIGTKKCHCFRQATLDLLYAQSNLKELLKEETFSAFSLDYYSGVHDRPGHRTQRKATARDMP